VVTWIPTLEQPDTNPRPALYRLEGRSTKIPIQVPLVILVLEVHLPRLVGRTEIRSPAGLGIYLEDQVRKLLVCRNYSLW
jgi:hypothetical protein